MRRSKKSSSHRPFVVIQLLNHITFQALPSSLNFHHRGVVIVWGLVVRAIVKLQKQEYLENK